jgi:hypothetical protein
MNPQSLPASLTIRALGVESEITITTPGRDLMADTIDPMGMDVTRYLNGTRAVNFAHDHGRLPVGKTLSLAQTPQGIRARFRWLDSNPEARVVRDVFADGVLGASVEFVPVEREANRSGGLHFAKSILTGWALTANPANPECVRMMKSLGLADHEPVLMLADDPADNLVAFEPRDLADALRAVVADQVRREVQRRSRELVGVRVPDDGAVLVLDDGSPGAADEFIVDPDDIKTAMAEVIAAAVGRELRQQLNHLTGRID